jgi:hypothetical protein
MFARLLRGSKKRGFETYESSVDHGHQLCLDFLVGDLMNVDASLVRKEHCVLALDHHGCDSEENDAHQGGIGATIAASRRHSLSLSSVQVYFNF